MTIALTTVSTCVILIIIFDMLRQRYRIQKMIMNMEGVIGSEFKSGREIRESYRRKRIHLPSGACFDHLLAQMEKRGLIESKVIPTCTVGVQVKTHYFRIAQPTASESSSCAAQTS